MPKQLDLTLGDVSPFPPESDTSGTPTDMARTGKAVAVNVSEDPEFGGKGDVYVGRLMRFGRFTKAKMGADGGYFGNPCKGDDAVDDFKAYFKKRVEEDPEFRKRLVALKGKRLGCWCKPNPCHADVIASYVNKL